MNFGKHSCGVGRVVIGWWDSWRKKKVFEVTWYGTFWMRTILWDNPGWRFIKQPNSFMAGNPGVASDLEAVIFWARTEEWPI